jgi:hypothetical protein
VIFFLILFKGGLFCLYSRAGGLSAKIPHFAAVHHETTVEMRICITKYFFSASGGSVPIRKRWLGEKSPAH